MSTAPAHSSSAASQRPCRRLVERLLLTSARHAVTVDIIDSGRIDLALIISDLLKAQAAPHELVEVTTRWVRTELGADAAWFERSKDLADDPESPDTEGCPPSWCVVIDGEALAGHDVEAGRERTGMLVVWWREAPAEQESLERTAHLLLGRAAVWLASALEVSGPWLERADDPGLDYSDVHRELLATVSHEVRTPLTTIMAGLEMLADRDLGPLTEPQARMIQRMEANARRLAGVADNAARVGHEGRVEIPGDYDETSHAEVATIVRNCLEVAEATPGVELRANLQSARAAISTAELRGMVDRVIDNALKFCPTPVVLTVTTMELGEWVLITVGDDGPGVPDEELPRLGNAFERTRAARMSQIQGAGLGLAAARTIAENRGGSMSLVSTLGAGFRVTFRLPIAPASEDQSESDTGLESV